MDAELELSETETSGFRCLSVSWTLLISVTLHWTWLLNLHWIWILSKLDAKYDFELLGCDLW